MNHLIIATALVAFSAASAYASSHIAEPQTSGSAGPKAAAEQKHQGKAHGVDNSAKQPEVQAPGSKAAQSAAERQHLGKAHGKADAVQSFGLKDGSTVHMFKDGKMAMEDKNGRTTAMKPGKVMETSDGKQLIMVGNELARLEWVRKSALGGN
jgi:hypothetical protein